MTNQEINSWKMKVWNFQKRHFGEDLIGQSLIYDFLKTYGNKSAILADNRVIPIEEFDFSTSDIDKFVMCCEKERIGEFVIYYFTDNSTIGVTIDGKLCYSEKVAQRTFDVLTNFDSLLTPELLDILSYLVYTYGRDNTYFVIGDNAISYEKLIKLENFNQLNVSEFFAVTELVEVGYDKFGKLYSPEIIHNLSTKNNFFMAERTGDDSFLLVDSRKPKPTESGTFLY